MGPPPSPPYRSDTHTDFEGGHNESGASPSGGGHMSYRMVNGKIESFIYRSSDGYSDDVSENYVWDGEDNLPLSYFEDWFAPTDKYAAEAVREAEDKHREAILEKVQTWRSGLPAADAGVDWDIAGNCSIQTL
ncbi:hypothetical protein EIP91_011377 [Steccherinum ochraceum]|uniref:Uncharacterized protein n=1 Tax=Steccherinum ochraceum TaxID=92696 RepID=A0A4R0RPW9_9APHY|nr:hypothetical protein EIP91_011377 [Steccherinum ochraceum]